MKTEIIKQIVVSLLSEDHLFLVDLKISRNNVIEVFIDSMQGVNLQTCINMSRKIESHLNRDEEDFELTVSSAGIGYPFKVEQQYQKNLNKTVEIQLQDNRKLQGILKAYSSEDLTLEYEIKQKIEGKKKKETIKKEETFLHSEIKEIKDIVTF